MLGALFLGGLSPREDSVFWAPEAVLTQRRRLRVPACARPWISGAGIGPAGLVSSPDGRLRLVAGCVSSGPLSWRGPGWGPGPVLTPCEAQACPLSIGLVFVRY